MMRPQLVERVLDEKGKLLLKSEPVLHRSVLERRTAEQIGRMMRMTVTSGTAKKFFFDDKATPSCRGGGRRQDRHLEQGSGHHAATPGGSASRRRRRQDRGGGAAGESPKWRIKAGYVGRGAAPLPFTKPKPRTGARRRSRRQH
jgi:hypothetical protein